MGGTPGVPLNKSYRMLLPCNNMPSKDSTNYKVRKATKTELQRIREVIAKELGVSVDKIHWVHAETAFRLKASRGKLLQEELNDILLGKIK